MSAGDIRISFPNLIFSNFHITSPKTPEYNCIAWAAGDTERWWWPSRPPVSYWPDGVPVEETLESFIKAFETIGFELCDNSDIEINFEKIAIYVNSSGKPTHASRQLENGKWTSKLGNIEDIEHDSLNGLYGSAYGTVCRFMRRKA